MAEQEIEDFEVDSVSDTACMLNHVHPPPYNIDDQPWPLEARSMCEFWGWALLVTAFNFVLFLLNFVLMSTVFCIVLLPTIVVVYFGFQCHSRVIHSDAYYCKTILDDNSSSALIILGFVLMSPLIVIAMVTYCSVARRLRLFLCFVPYSRAVYKGMKWTGHDYPSCCCCGKEWDSNLKAWV
ncbi:transmembrane protein 88 [Carcharodon carcharias]|uniref:transmembrane protein 88 n=1 Tax=Carcharodon carcharias TaxID=13397 RepID=UPI001B7ECBF7|nr:transmembrane protein 88 [Carcharodon carcharias]